MSTSPYSVDLRERVINYIESGNSKTSAAEIFCINISTVNRWYVRYKKEGNFLPRKRIGARSKIDKEALVNYINLNPDTKLIDVASKFGVSLWGIYYWLKKLGFI
jgi:transposase